MAAPAKKPKIGVGSFLYHPRKSNLPEFVLKIESIGQSFTHCTIYGANNIRTDTSRYAEFRRPSIGQLRQMVDDKVLFTIGQLPF